MENSNDEQLSQFMSITGCVDPERAKSYLEMAGGHLETAVSLYLEHTGGGEGVGGVGGDIGGGNGTGIRAPDQTQRMQLLGGMGDAMEIGHHEEADVFLPAFAATLDARQAVNDAAATTNGDDDDDEEIDSDMEDTSNNANTNHSMRLCDMFAPPTHLLHRAGGFQGARNVAKDARRWLLVNIQRDSDFACHALNRDVWRDELVENLIREGFIFWQASDTSGDGQTYCERYNVASFPHVGILDPRTGRLMHRKEGWTQVNPLTCEQFAEMAADFCSRHSLDQPPRPTKQQQEDDEQLQAAIRASMQQNNDDSDDEHYTLEDDDDDDDEEEEEAVVSKQPTWEEQLKSITVGEEPTGDSARVMIRMPDGKRLVRKFKKEDTVKIIYAFVAQSITEDKPFELKAGFPPKDLISQIDLSIQEAGLAGDTITVRWK